MAGLFRSTLTALAASLALASPSIAQTALLDDGRALSEAFLSGDEDLVWSRMTGEMQAAFGENSALSAFRQSLADSIGEEQEVTDETVSSVEGADVYRRTGRWSRSEPGIVMQWAFDAARNVSGFYVRPEVVLAESRFLDYETVAPLQLPFAGEWTLVWGGRTLDQNYHAADRAQRFAIDALIMRNGITHEGPADQLESYYCWGQPILAPAAGTVVAAVSDLPDQQIGQTDPGNPAGNHVVIDLGNDEFAFLAHFQQGSVRVSAGDAVEAGTELGLCGNSGNTSEPHLHFHLQNTPDLMDGEGLPARFRDYRVVSGEPVQGQVIAPAR
jgi:hypothetical protein